MLLSTVLLFLILWFGATCLFMVKLGVTFCVQDPFQNLL
jgi:hypothetical protein